MASSTTTERVEITYKYNDLSSLKDRINKFLEDEVSEVKDIYIECITNDPNPNLNRRQTMYYAVIRYIPVKK